MNLDELEQKEVGITHTIYGSWDDVIDDQFMLYEPEHSDHCIIFTFAGCDYGGGISTTLETTLEAAYLLLDRATYVWQFKDMVAALAKSGKTETLEKMAYGLSELRSKHDQTGIDALLGLIDEFLRLLVSK